MIGDRRSLAYIFGESAGECPRRIEEKIADLEHDLRALRHLRELIKKNPAVVEAAIAGLKALKED